MTPRLPNKLYYGPNSTLWGSGVGLCVVSYYMRFELTLKGKIVGLQL